MLNRFSKNPQIPNLMNGATGCDEVLKAFASDTTAMKTVDANNVYKMYYGCGCIDYCSKFFFGAKTSIYNDEILVNYSYKNTPMEKGCILNTDRGKAQISSLNKGLLYFKGAFLSCGRIGKCLDNRVIEFFWGLFKRECWYKIPKSERTMERCNYEFLRYIDYYNYDRPQMGLDHLTPYQYLVKKCQEQNKKQNKNACGIIFTRLYWGHGRID